jgi:hypothetical protein
MVHDVVSLSGLSLMWMMRKKDCDSPIELEGKVEHGIDCIAHDKFVCECGPFDVATTR